MNRIDLCLCRRGNRQGVITLFSVLPDVLEDTILIYSEKHNDKMYINFYIIYVVRLSNAAACDNRERWECLADDNWRTGSGMRNVARERRTGRCGRSRRSSASLDQQNTRSPQASNLETELYLFVLF